LNGRWGMLLRPHFGKTGVMGQWGLEWKVGDVVTTPFWKNGASRWMLKEIFIILGCPILCFS